VTRVLVVDDEPQILRALRINLRARRYDVSIAANGTQALDEAAAHPPDLVILDLGLPDMDGVDVIGGLRGWTAVPIIVLSGRADSTDKVEALDAGADDYVTKPFGMDELLARMRAAVRRTPAAEAPPRVRLGDLVIDLAAKRVTRQSAEPAVQGAAAGVAGLHGEAEVGEGDSRIRSDEGSATGGADPQPEGIRASCSATGSCCTTSGAPGTTTRAATSASTWRSCGASWKRTRPGRTG
jgi:CheY-like chemotaxis protein